MHNNGTTHTENFKEWKLDPLTYNISKLRSSVCITVGGEMMMLAIIGGNGVMIGYGAHVGGSKTCKK